MSEPPRRGKDRRLGLLGLSVFVGGFVLGLIAWALALGVVTVFGVDVERPTMPVLVASSIGLWVGSLGLPLLIARRHGGAAAFLGLRLRPLVDVPLGLVAGLASTFAVGVVTTLVLDKAERAELESKASEVIGRAQRPLTVAVLVLALCVITPVAEEVFYRGVLFRSTARLVPVPVAVVIAGALFGLVHYSGGSAAVVVNQLGLLAAFGAVLCVLTWRTGRLGAAIIAHATFNLFTVAAELLER